MSNGRGKVDVMKRLNHTLLLATVVMVSVSGCSGGKLRNLLSRNDYQTLEQQNAEQTGLPNEHKTQIASAETQKDKGFFKLPGFLKGEEAESAIAPDPFITASNPAATEDEAAAYRAKVDERIAREANAVKSTLASVEQQAQQLYEKSKASDDNPFSAFAETTPTTEQSVAAKDPQNDVATDDKMDSFAEMFGEQDKPKTAEVASPLIADTSDNPFAAANASKSDMSEFDKLLHAHEQLAPESSMATSDKEGMSADSDFFAEMDKSAKNKPVAQQPAADSFFDDAFASKDSTPNSSSDASFDSFVADTQSPTSNNDIWGQLDSKKQTAQVSPSSDVFAAAFDSPSPASTPDMDFDSDFEQTADRHGFSDTASTWGKLSPASGSDQGLTILASPEEERVQEQSMMAELNPSDFGAPQASGTDPFYPASQSQTVDSTMPPSQGQGMGLIIPASDSSSSESNAFFEFNEPSSGVQQISGTQAEAGLAPVASETVENDIDLFAETDAAAVAVQTVEASSGWTRRTWFLLIGCVLIAGLLFLPERQKR